MKLNQNNRLKKIEVRLLVFAASFVFGMLLFRTVHAQDANSLLWKIEGNELEQPSYIYGTIHAICKDDFFLTDAVNKAQSETEQTVMELDMDDPELMTKMQQNSVNEGMKNIVGEFTDEQKEVANAFFKANFGADLSQLGIVKPFALMAMVIQKSFPCSEVESYEMTFVKNAQAREAEILGLETVEFQTSIFDNESMSSQIQLLMTSITEFEEGKEEFIKMVDSYKKEDLKALRLIMTDSPEYAEFEDILINDRNADWISKIGEFALDKPTFFAVGALHLPGEKGVIALLKQEGYKVTPVK
jgi:uncharacterized protein YbaP (TraB family)